MKICYFVYREDNVLVYDSQVLEYLKEFKANYLISSTTLVLFRHHSNFRKKKEVEAKASEYVDRVKSFASLPLLTLFQLRINSFKARRFVKKTFSRDEEIAVICRGELSTCIAIKSFHGYKNVRILFDNRGIPVEESLLSHGGSFVHRLNRRVKRWAIKKAKEKSDIYNFVTSNMRRFCIEKYHYCNQKPYTIVPTLCLRDSFDSKRINQIIIENDIGHNELIFTYSGSLAAWQSESELLRIVKSVLTQIKNSKVLFLTKDRSQELDKLKDEFHSRIIVKCVAHDDMKYYLQLTDYGFIIRSDDIVNKVAAPTKIAEFYMYNVTTLYKGDIGIVDDLIASGNKRAFIEIDSNEEWLKKIISKGKKDTCISNDISFFDMKVRQKETYNVFIESFNKTKEVF